MKTTALKLLLPMLLLTLSCRVVGAAEEEGAEIDNTTTMEEETSYTKRMKQLQQNNPMSEELEQVEQLFDDIEEAKKSQKALDTDLEYNKRLRKHLKATVIQVGMKLALAKDFHARWDYHVASYKIVYIDQLKAEAIAERQPFVQRCEAVDKLNQFTLAFCQEQLAKIDQHLAELDDLLEKAQQEMVLQGGE